jgi:probable F420-dependent oxidoreductase
MKGFLERPFRTPVIMKVGITIPQVGETATRKNVIELVKASEAEEIDSLWVLDRLLYPLAPKTPYIGTHNGNLPPSAQNVFDPIELLTFTAANTNKIALGTSVLDMLFHNPVLLAKRFATLDVLSEGRLICGLGIGWSKDEYHACNVPFKQRGKRAIEFVEVLKRLWLDEVVEFKGQFYTIPASKVGPKPIQKPHPQIYLGAWCPQAFLRIVKSNASGWLASMGVGVRSLQYLENNIRTLRDLFETTKGTNNDFKVIVLTYPQTELKCSPTGERIPFTGSVDLIGNDVQKVKEMGVDHIIFCYLFSKENKNTVKTLYLTKKLSEFTR